MKKIFSVVSMLAVFAVSGFAAKQTVVQAGSGDGQGSSVAVSTAPAEDTRTNAEKLFDEDVQVRRNAVIYVGSERNKKNIPLLLPLLDDSSVEVRRAAIDALGKTGDKEEVPAALMEKFKSEKNYAVRQNIVVALGELQAKSALQFLKARLKDPFPGMRNEAIRALGKINDKSTYADITAMLKDQAEGTRIMAADVIGKLKIYSPAAVENLKKNLKDPIAIVRRSSVRALGLIGASSALPEIEQMQKDTDPTVAAAAKEAADQIKGKKK
ncbi:MAG: HEAT repeat domain-containing protein [Elusimicrobiota bacterium]